MISKFSNATKFLDYLNTTYIKLHKNYEDVFWLYRMGDYAYGDKMNKNGALRDAFRSNEKLKEETEYYIKKNTGEIKTLCFTQRVYLETSLTFIRVLLLHRQRE